MRETISSPWTWTRTPLLLALAIAASGCASPVPPTSLVEAENSYAQAAGDPQIANNAPVYLYEAKKDLDAAQRAWQADPEDPKVEHLSYVAEKRVAIARELALQRVADDEARALARERDRTLIEARAKQVDLARIAAEQARAREEEARLAAKQAMDREEQARATAAALEEQLAELKAKKTDRGTVVTLGDVLFDFGRATLRGGAQQDLYPLVTFLRENPERELLIEGHTDSVGSEAYNLNLSQQRAESVQRFLQANGVAAGRMAMRGFGEARPVASNESDAGRQQNRRVEIVILDPGKRAAEEIAR